MKACVLHNINDLRFEDVAVPVPARDEVLLSIRAAGICGSDIPRIFEKGTYRFPLIPGHEFSGEIVAAGEDADASIIGKKAAVYPLLPCFSCPACEIGAYALCADYDYYGSRRDGGFAEYLAVKTWNLVMVPDEVSFEEAALCEPTAVAIHALSRAGAGFGETVTIFGAGAIGIILAKIAQAQGAGQVILIDIDQTRLDFAARTGNWYCVNSQTANPVNAVLDLTGGRGSEVIVEGSGAISALESCLKSAAVFGRVVLLGNPLSDMAISQKSYWEILRRQLSLIGTWNSRYTNLKNDWQTAIRAIPSLGLSGLITHRFPLEKCNEAMEMLRKREEFAIKAMFINKGKDRRSL